jgi:protocatechuate 3,4-dioxygenase beta subunit
MRDNLIVRACVETLESRQFLSGDAALGSALDVPGGVDPNRFYLIGNSMTDGVGFNSLYAYLSAGGPTSMGRMTTGGRAIAELYHRDGFPISKGIDPARPGNTNPFGDYVSAFTRQWDVLTLQPHDRRHLTDARNGREEAVVPNVLKFMRDLSVNSPDAHVFVYSRTPRRTDVDANVVPTGRPFDYSDIWTRDYVDTGSTASANYFSRSSVTQLMSHLHAAQLADPIASQMPLIRLIPAGEVFYVIDQMIKSGAFAGTGIDSITDFYSDMSHPAFDIASYALGLTFNAVLTGADPRGIAPNSGYLPSGTKLTDANLARLIQQAVYDGIHFPGYAGYVAPTFDDVAATGTVRVNVQDETDAPLAGQPVYLDFNNNGALDTDEPAALTDAGGFAVISGVHAGDYRLRIVGTSSETTTAIRAGYASLASIQSESAATTTDVTLGTIRVNVFDDAIRNAMRDPGETGLAGVRVFIDTDADGTLDSNEQQTTTGTDGVASFGGVLPGRYTINIVGAYLTTAAHRDVWVIGSQPVRTVDVGVFALATDISQPPVPATGSISGVQYGDANLNGIYDPGEPLGSGRTIYLDQNNNGKLDSTELSVKTNSLGVYQFVDLKPGTYKVRRVFPAGYTYTVLPADVTVVAGQSITGVNISSRSSSSVVPPPPPPPPTTTGTIAGVQYNDANLNGVFDAGEPIGSGRTIYLDLNDNGVLDSGEPNVLTDASGAFRFNNVAPGTYKVRRVFPAGYFYSVLPPDVVVVAGQSVTGVNISSRSISTVPPPPPPPPVTTAGASIAGVQYNDANRNGLYDLGEPLGVARTIYLDLNDNGILDTAEPSVLTNAFGAYKFSGLAPGTYKVRRVFPTGYSYSVLPPDVTVVAGQAITGIDVSTSSTAR